MIILLILYQAKKCTFNLITPSEMIVECILTVIVSSQSISYCSISTNFSLLHFSLKVLMEPRADTILFNRLMRFSITMLVVKTFLN